MLLIAEPILGEDENAALADVVDSGGITMADRVRDFERAFAVKHGAEDGARLLADGKRLTEDTGWRPSVELSEGLERTISWWRGRLAGGLGASPDGIQHMMAAHAAT